MNNIVLYMSSLVVLFMGSVTLTMFVVLSETTPFIYVPLFLVSVFNCYFTVVVLEGAFRLKIFNSIDYIKKEITHPYYLKQRNNLARKSWLYYRHSPMFSELPWIKVIVVIFGLLFMILWALGAYRHVERVLGW